MNGADDGPRCSLISYVVPPGLSRAPKVEPSDLIPQFVPVEGVSARPSSSSRRATKTLTVAPSSPPLSPVEERIPNCRPTTQVNLTCTTHPDRAVTKPRGKPFGKSDEETSTKQPRKSCLSKTTQSVLPARLNLKKKTVAFGKTVNVSQTIEGTSKLSKLRQAMNKSLQSKENIAPSTDNKENEHEEAKDELRDGSLLEILKDVKSSLDVLKARDEERADELRNIRRIVDERGKEVDLLRGMFADYISKDGAHSSDSKVASFARRNAGDEDRSRANLNYGKFSRNPSPQRRHQHQHSPPTKSTGRTGSRSDPDPDDVDGITFEEFKRLLKTNPALRQFVLDIRHEEYDQRTGYADRHRKAERFETPHWKDSPRRTERPRENNPQAAKHLEEVKRREPRAGAKFTEKVTVERSIRCSPPQLAKYSVDTRRYIEDQILEEESEELQSMYCPGESVSYYPEQLRQRRCAGDLNDSHIEDERGGRKHDNMTAEERRRHRRDRRSDRCQDY
uniref:Protein kinase domain-containing protein n=1 Tax=Haemonchus contortus TaxID=6289 RepID=A0A7I5EBV5_HAECO